MFGNIINLLSQETAADGQHATWTTFKLTLDDVGLALTGKTEPMMVCLRHLLLVAYRSRVALSG